MVQISFSTVTASPKDEAQPHMLCAERDTKNNNSVEVHPVRCFFGISHMTQFSVSRKGKKAKHSYQKTLEENTGE